MLYIKQFFGMYVFRGVDTNDQRLQKDHQTEELRQLAAASRKVFASDFVRYFDFRVL
jgi:hypothetical protein